MAKIEITKEELKAVKNLQKQYRDLGIRKTQKECYQELGMRKNVQENEIIGWWWP